MTFPVVDILKITKPARPVFKVFIHCSASDYPAHDNAETMDNWHKERGWSGIGYHFFIKKDGTIQAGRNIEKTPAAQKNHNTGSIAICVHGLKKENFTKEQRGALKALCLILNRLYRGGITYHGHREVEPNKECPVFDYRAWLDLDKNGRMQTV